MKIIETQNATIPLGHYAQATKHNDIIYVSGQLGRFPNMSDDEAGDIEAQTRRCLNNIFAILEAAGSGAHKLLKVNVFISDIDLWPMVNHVYSQMIGDHKPARIVVPVTGITLRRIIGNGCRCGGINCKSWAVYSIKFLLTMHSGSTA